MPTITTEVDVDIELRDFDTDDIVEELEARGVQLASDHKQLIRTMYESYQRGDHNTVDNLLRELFVETIGRIA